ncbi:Neprilysin-1 [Nymphon striatum]|nr:Neprilysin-1 [Nymphon striatum]
MLARKRWRPFTVRGGIAEDDIAKIDRDWVERAADREDWRSRRGPLLSSRPIWADDDDDAVNTRIHKVNGEKVMVTGTSGGYNIDVGPTSQQRGRIEKHCWNRRTRTEKCLTCWYLFTVLITCDTTDCDQRGKMMYGFMDSSTKPCDNFYRYACGKYETSRTQDSSVIVDQINSVNQVLKGLLEAEPTAHLSTAAKNVRRFYSSCKNAESINSKISKQILDFMNAEKFRLYTESSWNLTDYKVTDDIINLLKLTQGSLFHFYIDVDPYNSSSFVPTITPCAQAFGMALIQNQVESTTTTITNTTTQPSVPSPNVTDAGATTDSIEVTTSGFNETLQNNMTLRQIFNDHQAQQLDMKLKVMENFVRNVYFESQTVTDATITDMKNFITTLFQIKPLEKNCSSSSDHLKALSNMTIRDLKTKLPEIDWQHLFNATIGKEPSADEVIKMDHVEFLLKLNELLDKTTSRIIRNSLMALLYIDKFHDVVKTDDSSDRSNLCLHLTKSHFGKEMSAMYIKTKTESDLNKVQQNVKLIEDYIKKPIIDRISGSNWMDESTINNSITKKAAPKPDAVSNRQLYSEAFKTISDFINTEMIQNNKDMLVSSVQYLYEAEYCSLGGREDDIADNPLANIKKFDCALLPSCTKTLQNKIRRTHYVRIMWGNAEASTPTDGLDPEKYGWKMENGCLVPNWFDGPVIPADLFHDKEDTDVDTGDQQAVDDAEYDDGSSTDSEWSDDSVQNIKSTFVAPNFTFYDDKFEGTEMSLDFISNLILRYKHMSNMVYSLYGKEVDPLQVTWNYMTNLPMSLFKTPYYDENNPNYINFATTGLSIAHEIAHSISGLGLLFNEGLSESWLSASQQQELKKHEMCFVDQYSKLGRNITFQDLVDYQTRVDGEATLYENIADQIGLQFAFEYCEQHDPALGDKIEEFSSDADKNKIEKLGYQDWLIDEVNEEHLVEGQEKLFSQFASKSPKELFFLAAAQVFCSHDSPTDYLISTYLGSHTPSTERVNGFIMNSPEFANAFKCPRGSSMNPNRKCSYI